MRYILTIAVFIAGMLDVASQVIFKTIVQKPLVIVGESFFVQYTVESDETSFEFTAPVFKGFRQIRGPEMYTGFVDLPEGRRPVKNYVFTLVPLEPGLFIIPAATARIGGRIWKSDHISITAIERKETTDNASEYFLAPGEDPYTKIRNNLFMKVKVDRRDCFVGQPVVATFTLYSRLQSKSDIVKNPGFYGFTVQDMISLDDDVSATETVNGKRFEVHTVRKVQLYPLRAGDYVIDPMEVLNKVEFSRSAINRKTEQQIAEGVFEDPTRTDTRDNLVTYENNIRTEPVTIHVNPLPEKNQPTAFNGATGRFRISASLEKKGIAQEEEGDLVVTVEGKGNFTQLAAPVIVWPDGIEGFAPSVTDQLNRNEAPLSGKRTFRFPFVAGKSGNYTIPPIRFSFFSTDSNSYQTVSTEALEITVSPAGKVAAAVPVVDNQTGGRSRTLTLRLIAGLATLLVFGGYIYYRRNRQTAKPVQRDPGPVLPDITTSLQPAVDAAMAGNERVHLVLQQCIWNYLGQRLSLTGFHQNKKELARVLHEQQKPMNIVDILEECEKAAYTHAHIPGDIHDLILRTRRALQEVS